MLLVRIAEVSQAVGAVSGRLAKVDLLAGALREAGPAVVPIAELLPNKYSRGAEG